LLRDDLVGTALDSERVGGKRRAGEAGRAQNGASVEATGQCEPETMPTRHRSFDRTVEGRAHPIEIVTVARLPRSEKFGDRRVSFDRRIAGIELLDQDRAWRKQ